MKRLLILLAAAVPLTLHAQRYGETCSLQLWDNTTAPHSNELTGPESEFATYRISNVTQTELYLFAPDTQRATGQGVVICPGGGYGYVSMDNEGFLMARWFAQQGITAAVLKYRMPNGHPEVPMEDVELALRILRGEVAAADCPEIETLRATGLTVRQAGVVGSSAGGHLAAMTSTMGAVRPDFTVLFYPVITGETGWCHAGTFDNLLGKSRTAALTASYSLENRVDGRTPPALIFHCDDDRGVPALSATRYYEALRRQAIPATIHIYPSGGHGWGFYDHFGYKEQVREALADWLARIAPKQEE